MTTPPRCRELGCTALDSLDFLHTAFKIFREGKLPTQTAQTDVRICHACVTNIVTVYGAFFEVVRQAHEEQARAKQTN